MYLGIREFSAHENEVRLGMIQGRERQPLVACQVRAASTEANEMLPLLQFQHTMDITLVGVYLVHATCNSPTTATR